MACRQCLFLWVPLLSPEPLLFQDSRPGRTKLSGTHHSIQRNLQYTNESRDGIQSTATLLLGLFNAAEEERSVPSALATNASSDWARL